MPDYPENSLGPHDPRDPSDPGGPGGPLGAGEAGDAASRDDEAHGGDDEVHGEAASPDTPTPDTPTADTPAPDAPTPDTPTADTPAPDTPAPDTPPMPAPAVRSTSGHRTRRGRRHRRLTWTRYKRRRRVVWAIVIAALGLLAAAGWVTYRAYQAHDHLQRAASLASTLQDELRAVDIPAARSTLADLQDEAAAAHSAAHDFLWSVGNHIPSVGDNLQAVRTVADVIDELSWRTLPPLIDAAERLEPANLAPDNGVINIDSLQEVAPDIYTAAKAIHQMQDTVAGIDRGQLVTQVSDAVDELGDKLDQAADTADTAAKVVRLMPPMLGADGPRTYLVVFQNLAEVRATGGIFGAFAVITADHGHIEMSSQGASSSDLRGFDPPLDLLSDMDRQLYTDRPATFPMDVNFSPNFPTAAVLIRDMYQQVTGTSVDGVIATDPVALSGMLEATGPISLPNGDELTADNAVKYLLADAYVGRTPQESDELFEQAAEAVFQALVSGQGSPSESLEAVEQAADQNRLLVWSADADEQEELSSTELSGTLPRDDGSDPLVGVFLNDGTGGKMDYFLRETVDLKSTGCVAGGKALVQATVTLTSTAPSSGLPDYVTGMALGGDYVTRTNVMFFSPTKGSLRSVEKDGEKVAVGTGIERGRFVGILTVDLKPGETTTVTATLATGELPESGMTSLRLKTTPLAFPADTTVGEVPACAAG